MEQQGLCQVTSFLGTSKYRMMPASCKWIASVMVITCCSKVDWNSIMQRVSLGQSHHNISNLKLQNKMKSHQLFGESPSQGGC